MGIGDNFAIFNLVFAGLYTNRWLLAAYPWTRHPTVRYLIYISALSTICWWDGVMDIQGRTLVFFAIGLGFVLSDLLALSKEQPINGDDSCADNIENSPSIQGMGEAPQDEKSNPENNATDSATLQQTTEETTKPLEDEQYSHEEASAEAALLEAIENETRAMHTRNENIINGAAPNKLNRYEARATPNKRLVPAFHVNNCFTEDKERCDEFRNHVMDLLQPNNKKKHWSDWFELVEVARTVSSSVLSVRAEELNLFDAIHLTVMKTMLKVLFGHSPTDASKDGKILKLAKGVNQQWIDSKKAVNSDETPGWEFERQASLKAVAVEIFGPWDAENKKNPFNKILPGYETMWRVVLRCILEVSSSRHASATTEAWKERLALFIENPNRTQLQQQKNHAGLTVEHISFEVLRLYPPTRHVARLQRDPDGDGERIQTADIEKLHHKAPIWNPDPMNFRPERWVSFPKGMNTKGFMPFGEYPFRCPARQHQGVEIPFGVTMIAVLSGCFIEAMVGKWRLSEEGIPPSSKPLCNGRKSYAEVSLHRIKPRAANIPSNLTKKAVTEKLDTDKTEAEKSDADKVGNKVQTDDEAQTGDDAKTVHEAKTELSERNHSIGEDERQTDAAQQ